jgi:hypothetical protein
MQVNAILKSFSLVLSLALLTTCIIASTSKAESNNSEPYSQTPASTFTGTKNQELIFKTPDQYKNDTSKIEYKSSVALPTDESWKVVEQQEASSQFNTKIVKKDNNNFFSVLATNQYPSNTIRVVVDKIDIVDIDSRFYRIPNFKTEAANDYLYLSKSNTTLNYKPTAEEVKAYNGDKTSTIYLTNNNGQYSAKAPEEKEYQLAMIQEKVGDNDWNYAKQLSINLTANTPQNLEEADKLIKGSTFDNQNYQLPQPTPLASTGTNTGGSNSGNTNGNPAPQAAVPLPEVGAINTDYNIIPYIATLAGFGILNLGIRQYFKKQ